MPTPPENITRDVKCPNCGVSRTTKAQPNTNLRCRNCGQMFKVPRPGAPPEPVSPPITGDTATGPTPPAGETPPKRVKPSISPAPPPPEGVADDGGAEGPEPEPPAPVHHKGGVPPVGAEPEAEPPAPPTPEPEPTPPPPAEPEPKQSTRGARRWRR